MRALSDVRVAAALALLILVGGGYVLPDWALFPMTIALYAGRMPSTMSSPPFWVASVG